MGTPRPSRARLQVLAAHWRISVIESEVLGKFWSAGARHHGLEMEGCFWARHVGNLSGASPIESFTTPIELRIDRCWVLSHTRSLPSVPDPTRSKVFRYSHACSWPAHWLGNSPWENHPKRKNILLCRPVLVSIRSPQAVLQAVADQLSWKYTRACCVTASAGRSQPSGCTCRDQQPS